MVPVCLIRKRTTRTSFISALIMNRIRRPREPADIQRADGSDHVACLAVVGDGMATKPENKSK